LIKEVDKMEVQKFEVNMDMDEETQQLLINLGNKLAGVSEKVVNVDTRLGNVEEDIKTIRDCMVTIKEYWPVRTIAYFLVGSMGAAVLMGIYKWVIK